MCTLVVMDLSHRRSYRAGVSSPDVRLPVQCGLRPTALHSFPDTVLPVSFGVTKVRRRIRISERK
jgi:hypothetical protein